MSKAIAYSLCCDRLIAWQIYLDCINKTVYLISAERAFFILEVVLFLNYSLFFFFFLVLFFLIIWIKIKKIIHSLVIKSGRVNHEVRKSNQLFSWAWCSLLKSNNWKKKVLGVWISLIWLPKKKWISLILHTCILEDLLYIFFAVVRV